MSTRTQRIEVITRGERRRWSLEEKHGPEFHRWMAGASPAEPGELPMY